jgi:hypothetical protein
VRWWSSLQHKVLCRKVAAKWVEDGADKQSACSQVLVRQISQLANAASGVSFRTHEKCCLLLHLLFEPAVEQPSQLNSRPCNPHICMSLHMHQCKSLLVIWTWRRRRRRQWETSRQRSFIYAPFWTLFFFCNCLVHQRWTVVCTPFWGLLHRL